jgi:hypothetical protein
MIVLCTPGSLSRLWVGFEAGVGWHRGIPVIPVCVDEVSFKNLPEPLSMHQAIHLEDRAGWVNLLKEVSRICGLGEPSAPHIDSILDTIRSHLELKRALRESRRSPDEFRITLDEVGILPRESFLQMREAGRNMQIGLGAIADRVNSATDGESIKSYRVGDEELVVGATIEAPYTFWAARWSSVENGDELQLKYMDGFGKLDLAQGVVGAGDLLKVRSFLFLDETPIAVFTKVRGATGGTSFPVGDSFMIRLE